MPIAPMPYCLAPDCRVRVPRGYCLEHRRAVERMRGSAAARGYGRAWAAYSRRRLLAHPFCVRCAARRLRTPATVTDHVLDARTHPDRFWDPTNHQSLCHACNVAKAREAARLIGHGGR